MMKNKLKLRSQIYGIALCLFLLINPGLFAGTAGQTVFPAGDSGASPEWAQQVRHTVSGKVTDQQGQPLPGVTIVIRGTMSGVITGADGSYTVPDVPNDATLVFSFVGMETQELPLAGRTRLDVVLAEATIGLEEVVAIGYGTQQKREVSGSITNVLEKDFNQGVNRTAVDMLQGKVAGLVITSGSGDVSSEKTVRLRGTSSLTGSSEPFVVIDGVPGLSMNSVAPQDIESVSVLKDASAAAIYGSRSASGVIVITTKTGKENRSEIRYNGYVAADVISNKPDVLTASEWRDYCAANNIDTKGLDKGADTDWFDEIMRVGITHNHDISLSGGAANHNYRASVSYQEREGLVKDNYQNRLNARLSFTQKALEDRLSITLTGALAERDYSPSYTDNFVLAYNMLPVYPVKNSDGSWFDSEEYDQGNPVRNIEYNKSLHKNNLYYLNAKAELEIADGLVAGVNVLKERENDDYGQYYHSETEAGRNDNGYAKREVWTRDKKLLETTLNYQLELGAHKLNFLGGYSWEHNKYQLAGAQNRQFSTDFFGYHNLGAGENLLAGDVWSSANMSRLISFFGRVNYLLNGKYILTGTIRRDGSSKFGENHKWGTFPSVSAAWRLVDEPFMQAVGLFDELKLRAGYGVSGNQDGLDPYQSLELYGSSGQYYDDGKWYTAYQISQNANPDLKWEETAMFNAGADFSLLERRISGSLEYYHKKTTDLLYTYQVPVPPYLYPEMIANVGDMKNEGFEAVINGDVIRKDGLRWTVSVNLAHNKNEITRLSNADFATESIKTGDAWIRGGSDNTTHIVEEGREVGTFYGWRCFGLDENGKYIMDEMVDGKEGLSEEDRTYIGSAQPDLTYGISSMLSWKNFEFSFFLRGVYGNDVLNFSRMSYGTSQWLPGANVLKDALTSGLTDNPKYCSYYIEKGSFLRMDNATVAYNFDTANWWGIKQLRVYLTAQNLFTITGYDGLDPEVEMGGLDPGVEGREYYPKARTFSLGVNLSF
jgi:iron complex outermembrane receptor protein